MTTDIGIQKFVLRRAVLLDIYPNGKYILMAMK